MNEKNKRDPTMEIQSKEEKEEVRARLKQQYKDLTQDWDTLKQTTNKPRERTRSRSLSESRSKVKTLKEILDNSPRGLMSSLQLEEGWKVRNNDLAFEETSRERKAAIESGKLKGRRLFEEGFCDIEREEIGLDGLDELVQESSEVMSTGSSYVSNEEKENLDVPIKRKGFRSSHVSCCLVESLSASSTSSFVCDECMEKELVVKNEEKVRAMASMQGGESGGIGYGKRWIVLAIRFVVCLLVGAIGLIFYRVSFSGHTHGDQVFLVPT